MHMHFISNFLIFYFSLYDLEQIFKVTKSVFQRLRPMWSMQPLQQ